MKLTKKQRIEKVLSLLDEHYGTEKICYLNHESPWQLLIAVILSAQCTDARVNIVTGPLFDRYPDAAALADADIGEGPEYCAGLPENCSGVWRGGAGYA